MSMGVMSKTDKNAGFVLFFDIFIENSKEILILYQYFKSPTLNTQ